jgi:hypothetical protein
MLLIFTPFNSNRLKYVADYIFRERLCLAYEITNDPEVYIAQKNLQKFSYSPRKINDGLFFFASSSILDETDIKHIELDKSYYHNSPVLFAHQNKNSALPFDIFAAIFYLLSRYEEYVYKEKDEYGNFDYRQSILYKLNVLGKPLVDEWINIFKNILKEHFSSLNFKTEKPRYVLTFDIDVAYEYKNRTAFRMLGGLAKKLIALNFKMLQDQVLTLLNKKRDSFDTYQYIEEKIKNNTAIFFFNMGKYGKFDKNPSYKNKTFRQLICSIQQKYFTGIHPSYASNYNDKLLTEEKRILEKITQQKVTISRQHYLKIAMPATFKRLLQNGIKKDFSTGYYLSYGFRAGTCHPFPFFDLATNEATNLYLYPFAFMDGTLNEVLHLSPANAKEHISQLIETVKKFNGIFIPIWHNSTLSESGIWKDWRSVFEYMLKELEENNFESITNIEEK